MENHYQGDLGDVVRAGGGTSVINRDTTTATTSHRFGSSWKTTQEYHLRNNYDVYSFPEDTLLRDMDAISTSTTLLNSTGVNDSTVGGGGELCSSDGLVQVMGPGSAPAPNSNNLSNNFSSNMVQISQDNTTSTNTSSNSSSNNDVKLPMLPTAAASSMVVKAEDFGFMSNQMASIDASCSSSPKAAGGFASSATETGPQLQIPSPQNQGIKRRKIQAKKVVCIPAPAAANSRQTGEVVPSDLWAWRKYGQKPIKGSPYPRGYYRCSSSKGCSARKQVERSRTDPNMLVITYTSEHNHPWPTQRNALAGSTRSSHPASKASSKASLPSEKPSNNNFSNVLIKEETLSVTANKTSLSIVKEEIGLNDNRFDSNKVDEIIESYRPLILPEPKINVHDHQADQDFFADMVEFESDDPLELFNSQGCNGFYSFSGLFDWASNNTTPTNEEDNHDHTKVSSHQEQF